MKVKKRDGGLEDFNIEKIHDVLFWATKDIKGVNVSDIEINTQLQLHDGIESTKIHEVLIYAAADLISDTTPNYQHVAANLLNYFLRKQVFGVSDNMPSLLSVIKKNIDYGVYDTEILELYSEDEIEQLERVIRHNRDYLFVYAGLQQLVDKYLLKDRTTSKIYETPQYMYMLIAMILNSNEKENRLKAVKSFYNDISSFEISLPTPIMCGVRTPSPPI